MRRADPSSSELHRHWCRQPTMVDQGRQVLADVRAAAIVPADVVGERFGQLLGQLYQEGAGLGPCGEFHDRSSRVGISYRSCPVSVTDRDTAVLETTWRFRGDGPNRRNQPISSLAPSSPSPIVRSMSPTQHRPDQRGFTLEKSMTTTTRFTHRRQRRQRRRAARRSRCDDRHAGTRRVPVACNVDLG